MKKILTTLIIAILCCAMTTTVHAQDKVEQALKLAEQKAKFADENMENGKVQYEAAVGASCTTGYVEGPYVLCTRNDLYVEAELGKLLRLHGDGYGRFPGRARTLRPSDQRH